MTETTTPEVTWVVEQSYEAVTLDYLAPRWTTREGVFATEAEASAEATRLSKKSVEDGFLCAYRAKRVVAERPESGYVDQGLEADFAANKAYWAGQAAAARAQEQARREIMALKGMEVEVVKGRKVPKGTKGVVFWVGESTFGYTTTWRVGFKTAEGEKHFTALSNVEAVEGWPYEEEVA